MNQSPPRYRAGRAGEQPTSLLSRACSKGKVRASPSPEKIALPLLQPNPESLRSPFHPTNFPKRPLLPAGLTAGLAVFSPCRRECVAPAA
eukprot:1916409-Rhodomonas_salina.2